MPQIDHNFSVKHQAEDYQSVYPVFSIEIDHTENRSENTGDKPQNIAVTDHSSIRLLAERIRIEETHRRCLQEEQMNTCYDRKYQNIVDVSSPKANVFSVENETLTGQYP
jgi:hypothetical protein